MRSLVTAVVFVLVAAAAPLVIGGQSRAAALFAEALLLERADGKIAEAVVRYERVVAEFPKDAEVAPKALDRLAQVYAERNDPRAVVMLTRLVTDYPDAHPYVDAARTRLATLQASSASAFRHRTPPFPMTRLNIAPNGKWAVVPALQNGPRALSLRDIATGADRPIDLGAAQIPVGFFPDAVWSPDSRWIALSVVPAASGRAASMQVDQLALGELRVFAVDTLESRTICPSCRALEWSPDATQLAVYAGTTSRAGEIRVLTIGTGSTQTVARTTAFPNSGFGEEASRGSVAWSPDGRRLAFRAFPDPQTDEIRIVTLATGESQTLPVPGLEEGWRARIVQIENTSTAWTTKNDLVIGKRSASGAESEIVLVPIGGGPPRTVCSRRGTVDERCRGLTPDGVYAIFARPESHRYFLRTVATGEEHPLTLSSGEEWWAKMTPDGRMMTLISNREGGGKWGLYVVPLGPEPVANPVRLARFEDLATRVITYHWANDGTLLAGFDFDTSNIYRVPMDATTGRSRGPLEQITHEAAENDWPQISLDGKQIVYRQPAYTTTTIGVMNLHGIAERPVRSATGQALEAFFSVFWRNSVEVIFDADTTRTGANQNQWRAPILSVLNVSTGSVLPLAHGDIGGDYFAWQYVQSRNELVYLRRGSPSILRARSLTDGTDRVIVRVDNPPIRSFAVAPDGRQIAFQSGGELRLVTGDGVPVKTLHVSGPGRSSGAKPFPADASSPATPVPTAAIPMTWSPNGKYLLFQIAWRPRVMNVETMEHWPLMDDLNQPQISNGASWAPDGSYLLLSAWDTRHEPHVWEGVTYEAVAKAIGARSR